MYLLTRSAPLSSAMGTAADRTGRRAIIVDPYSTASELPTVFAGRGVACVAVLSTPEPPEIALASWHPADFARIYRYAGDVDALASAVAAEDPLCVIAGVDFAVELTDALVDRLRPGTGNVSVLSAARRDKYRMAMALRDAGVPHLRQACSSRPEDIEAWIGANRLDERPLVVKPPRSSGTEDVYLVRPGEDWRPYFDHILGKTNSLEERNHAVLVQEFAAGVEYMVDTYSVDGEHGLVETCRYTKQARDDRIGIYDCADYLAPDEPEVGVLFAYTRRVLDALGFRNGPCHAEVMLTARGPVLIEVGARTAGGPHQEMSRLATGDCQVDRCVRHHVDGAFRPGYELLRHVKIAVLSSPRSGTLLNGEVLEALDRLPTVHATHLRFATGDRVPATVDLFSSLGHVVFAGDDERQIRADYDALKRLEAQLRVKMIAQPDAPRPDYVGA
jgi:biotin carboxylase